VDIINTNRREAMAVYAVDTPPAPIICEKCEGYGWIGAEVDHFGRKLEWVRCGVCGGLGELEEEEAA
jgi:DnaJ-class molecular chaperone